MQLCFYFQYFYLSFSLVSERNLMQIVFVYDFDVVKNVDLRYQRNIVLLWEQPIKLASRRISMRGFGSFQSHISQNCQLRQENFCQKSRAELCGTITCANVQLHPSHDPLREVVENFDMVVNAANMKSKCCRHTVAGREFRFVVTEVGCI